MSFRQVRVRVTYPSWSGTVSDLRELHTAIAQAASHVNLDASDLRLQVEARKPSPTTIIGSVDEVLPQIRNESPSTVTLRVGTWLTGPAIEVCMTRLWHQDAVTAEVSGHDRESVDAACSIIDGAIRRCVPSWSWAQRAGSKYLTVAVLGVIASMAISFGISVDSAEAAALRLLGGVWAVAFAMALGYGIHFKVLTPFELRHDDRPSQLRRFGSSAGILISVLGGLAGIITFALFVLN